MSGASESLARKISGAKDLSSVVRSMKALAASSVGQYERAVESLREYASSLDLALSVCLRGIGSDASPMNRHRGSLGVIVIGSDQGLVGRFNEILLEDMVRRLDELSGRVTSVWAVGERIEQLLPDAGLPQASRFDVPYSVETIVPLVGEIIVAVERARERGSVDEVHVFHNRPFAAGTYGPGNMRLLPLDARWRSDLTRRRWPTVVLPEVIDGPASAAASFIRSYLFVVLFQACAESLASENASRLAAMQRAEENIAALLDDLTRQFHRMRQASIDEELFEVVSGYEALLGSRDQHV